jgi:hypothetical protein
MVPLGGPGARYRLSSVKLAVTRVPDWSVPFSWRTGPPVSAEDGSVVSMWRPRWHERVRLALGAPVRIILNFGPYGPLHVDTQSESTSPTTLDW